MSKKKTDSSKRPKAARFNEPITMVKTTAARGDKKVYQGIHVSFQSTSSCNISTVNALTSSKLTLRRKERGHGEYKRYWVDSPNDRLHTHEV